jgi:DNA repair exonuclease SbcCD ATPase subunit
MIGALLSNAPVGLLRHSGVAGETRPGPEEHSTGRDGAPARDSQASQRAANVRAGGSPPLTAEAVLALQESDAPAGPAARAPGAQTGSGDDSDGQTLPAEGAQAGAAGEDAGQDGAVQGAAVQGQQDPDSEEDPDGDGLNAEEEKQVEKLKERDREVRAHEQAHARVGGAYAGAPSYTFQQGPDGKRYAIGGEVQIDTARERTPEATIRKMQVVIRAATAPAEPSSQDLKVAQQARSQLAEAQAELRQQKAEELNGDDEAAGSQSVASGRVAPQENGAEETSTGDRASAGGDDRRQAAAAISAYQSAARQADETNAGGLLA